MQKIRIDFDNPGLPQHISAVENDSQSRFFEASLYENGKAYTAPEGATYSIMYRGFGPQNQGWYDTINDGAGKRAACAVSGNVVTCEIARQALQVPGHMTVVLCVTNAKGYMLKSWPIMANVRNDDYDNTAEIEMYFNLSGIAGNYLSQLEKAMANAEKIGKDLTATADQTKQAIDEKAKAALASIPEDYTSLSESVGQLKEDLKANGFNKDYLRIIYEDMVPSAPYDNCDTVPSNSIVSYSKNFPSNAPKEIIGTLISFGNVTGSVVSGQIQLYMTSDSSLYARISWGNPIRFSNWNRIDNVEFDISKEGFNHNLLKIFLGSTIDVPYNNCNTVPGNSIVSYAASIFPANLPVEEYGTLISYSSETNVSVGGEVQIYTTITNKTFMRISWGAGPTWSNWNRIDNVPSVREDVELTTGCYKTFGVIGDSYSSGETYYNNEFHDNYYCSWGQILARKLGNKCINFSAGGLTTRTWLTNPHGLALLNSSPACDLYWCALGINDTNVIGKSYLGTIADIKENPENNADTFYGNYGKIISAILTKNPNATIILTNIVLVNDEYNVFSNAIKEIAEHFGIMFIDTHSGFFTSEKFTSTMVSGHPTNQTYTGMANAYDRLFSDNYMNYHTYLYDHYNGYVD